MYADIWHAYWQDSYKLRSNLTLNIGLRFEHNPFFTGLRGQNSGLDFQNGKIVIPMRNAVVGVVDTGIGIFMVCSRQAPADTVPSREVVNRTLLAARLDALARGYLRDLRRAAVVDIRNAAL